MDTIIRQIDYLLKEIADKDNQLMANARLIAALVVVSYIAAVWSEKHALYKVPMILLISGTFLVAAGQYLEHRPAPWISQAQKIVQTEQGLKLPAGFKNWEDYHASLNSRKFFLAPVLILAALAFFWIFYASGKVVLAQDPAFFWGCVAALAVAVASVFIGLAVVDK